VVLTLAEGLAARGHIVSLISLRDVLNYTLPENINYYVVQDSCKHPWRKLTDLRRRSQQLDKILLNIIANSGMFSLVVSHLHKTDRIVSRSRCLKKNNTWFCIHGIFSKSYLSNKKGLMRWLKILKIRQIYQNRNIIGVSDEAVIDLCQMFTIKPNKARVIFNPFDSASILAEANQPLTQAPAEYILHVGRFHPNKRHDRLLHAYSYSGIQSPLVLLGQGDSTAIKVLATELGIGDKVIFAGFDKNPYRWIKHAKLLVLSSDSEGFGNVLVEALICRTPVVSTRCSSGPISILSGNLQKGLADLSPESLANTMREIYQHPIYALPEQLQKFELETICQQYLKLTLNS
jgi:glycosyltransferase involved in cell wall biosynthesis